MEWWSELEGFDWDAGNLTKNWDRHRVVPTECEQAFFNRPIVVGDDEPYCGRERRYYLLGITDMGRRLFLVFTVRQRRVRVISARDMNKRERGVYEQAEAEAPPEISD
jgi:hypothetical protein